jgi:hypothetical protein
MQGELIFPSDSPLNTKKLSGQNLKLYEFLQTGKAIHCLSEDKIRLGIGYLNSRASDLINKFKIPISKKYITVNDTTVVEYSLKK